jgi:hypothetical protein
MPSLTITFTTPPFVGQKIILPSLPSSKTIVYLGSLVRTYTGITDGVIAFMSKSGEVTRYEILEGKMKTSVPSSEDESVENWISEDDAEILCSTSSKPQSKGDSFQVFVKTISGLTHAISVFPEEKILSLKQKIQDKACISLDGQLLVLAGMQLQNERTLADYGIQTENTIRAVALLRGG